MEVPQAEREEERNLSKISSSSACAEFQINKYFRTSAYGNTAAQYIPFGLH